MTLNIEKEYDLDRGIDYEETALQVTKQVLTEESCPYEAEVSLLLTSDEEIHELNLQYRGIDRQPMYCPFRRSHMRYRQIFPGRRNRK